MELQEAAIFKKPDKEEKTLVAFDMASFPLNRPFLLSRDMVYVRPSGTQAEPFQVNHEHRPINTLWILNVYLISKLIHQHDLTCYTGLYISRRQKQ